MSEMSTGREQLPPDDKGWERIRIHIPPGQSRERLDTYLTHQIENATRTKVQEAIRAGMILLNGRTCKSSMLIAPMDILEITFPRPPKPDIVPEKIPLEIVYEDEWLLVINKPAGMVVHPAYTHYSGTLVNALLHYTDTLSSEEKRNRPGIVHRLDKDTSGLLVVAKDNVTHHRLARQFSSHDIEREYQAVVWGRLRKSSGVIETKLGRSKRDRKKFAVTSEGKLAITLFEVVREFSFLSLVTLRLKTGRTHQIRVHLSHLGHPIFGDQTYGGGDPGWGGLKGSLRQMAKNMLLEIHRQALHARVLGFRHPHLKKELIFDSPLPKDIAQVLEKAEIEKKGADRV